MRASILDYYSALLCSTLLLFYYTSWPHSYSYRILTPILLLRSSHPSRLHQGSSGVAYIDTVNPDTFIHWLHTINKRQSACSSDSVQHSRHRAAPATRPRRCRCRCRPRTAPQAWIAYPQQQEQPQHTASTLVQLRSMLLTRSQPTPAHQACRLRTARHLV